MSRQDRAYAVARNFAALMDRQAAEERKAKEAEQRAARAALEAAKEEERKREEEEKVAVVEEERRVAGAQWGMLAGSAPLSREEWEEGARIRRERAERRGSSRLARPRVLGTRRCPAIAARGTSGSVRRRSSG